MARTLFPDSFDGLNANIAGTSRAVNRERRTYQDWCEVWTAMRNTCLGRSPLMAILAAFGFERGRQIEKWGDQTHPCVPAELPGIPSSHAIMLRSIAQEMEHAAKTDCNNAFREGKGTWAHIAAEELYEAMAAPPDKRREELVQLGAVITAWIEDFDSRTASKDS